MVAPSAAPRWWARRRLAYVGAGALGVAGASMTGAAVAGLDALLRVRPRRPLPSARVTAVAPSHTPGCTLAITLDGPGAVEPGWMGLTTDQGRLLAGPPTRTPTGWVRDAVALPGAPAPLLEPGLTVSVAPNPWEGCDDPLGLGARTIAVCGELGPFPVTSVGSPSASRALVYVHGRGAHRTDGWWLAPTGLAAGWRTVMPAYRNSADGGPVTGRYLLGGEWCDLVTVLDRLAEDGVEQVVLAGWSMGGNVCASYLRQRHRRPEPYSHHPTPVGLVLDAAALDWGRVLAHVARARRLPRRLVPFVMTYGQLARRIDWQSLDHLAEPEHLELPILAFHGREDDVVPCELSELLAERLPHMELEVFEAAGHCRSVNVDPARYLGAVRHLLDRVAA